MTTQSDLDAEIRTVLSEAKAPLSTEQIAERVADRLGCLLTDVERWVVLMKDVEQGFRKWMLLEDT